MLTGIEEETFSQMTPENFQYDINSLKAENLFEILELRNDIDILCIKAKNAHVKYDIAKAYDIAVKYIISKFGKIYFMLKIFKSYQRRPVIFRYHTNLLRMLIGA